MVLFRNWFALLTRRMECSDRWEVCLSLFKQDFRKVHGLLK